MDGDEKANIAKAENSRAAATKDESSEMSLEEHAERIRQLKAELESGDFEESEPEYEDVPLTDEAMEALSEEELQEQIDLHEERIELAERQKELDRKALNLGLLKLAQQAPRCSHLKSNGKPCRAPAMGNRLFCVFHSRALETQDNPRINVTVLEDRESLQLTVKQIMEQIVSGRIEPQNASLLLRAVQIANSTFKSRRDRERRRKPASSETSARGNPEENSG